MTTITIKPIDESNRAALWCQYPGQSPQPVYIEFDPDTRELSADWDGETGNAVPESVFCRRRLRWYGLPSGADPVAVNKLLRELVDGGRLDTIADGYICEDGRGYYTAEAENAIREIETIMHDCRIESSVYDD